MKYKMRGQLTIIFNRTHPNPSPGSFSKFPSHSGGWQGRVVMLILCRGTLAPRIKATEKLG